MDFNDYMVENGIEK